MTNFMLAQMENIEAVECPLIPVKPLIAIFIKPGCRHRAVGQLRTTVIPIQAFDPAHEWFD